MTYNELWIKYSGKCETLKPVEVKNEIVEYMTTAYSLSKSAADYIYSRAFERGHSSGYYEVLECADDYAEMCCYVNSLLEGGI